MDFSKILEEWEKKNNNYPVKDISEKNEFLQKADKNISRLKKIEPQAVLDLHGYTSAEAEAKINNFLFDAKAQGLIKVLIIHGKGNHSASGPVLKNTAQEAVRNSPYAGLSGIPDRKTGGSGALWVIIK